MENTHLTLLFWKIHTSRIKIMGLNTRRYYHSVFPLPPYSDRINIQIDKSSSLQVSSFVQSKAQSLFLFDFTGVLKSYEEKMQIISNWNQTELSDTGKRPKVSEIRQKP